MSKVRWGLTHSNVMATLALFLALAVGGMLAGSASAYIYVGNGPYIARANNDGTGMDPDFITVDSNGFVCGVAVDSPISTGRTWTASAARTSTAPTSSRT